MTDINVERASQILESKDTINVMLSGDPVWIEKVDAGSGIATVHLNANPADTRTVSVTQLTEQ